MTARNNSIYSDFILRPKKSLNGVIQCDTMLNAPDYSSGFGQLKSLKAWSLVLRLIPVSHPSRNSCVNFYALRILDVKNMIRQILNIF